MILYSIMFGLSWFCMHESHRLRIHIKRVRDIHMFKSAGALHNNFRDHSFLASTKYDDSFVGQGVNEVQYNTSKFTDSDDLDKLTVNELKGKLRSLSLPVSGLKQKLIERLRETIPEIDTVTNHHVADGANDISKPNTPLFLRGDKIVVQVTSYGPIGVSIVILGKVTDVGGTEDETSAIKRYMEMIEQHDDYSRTSGSSGNIGSKSFLPVPETLRRGYGLILHDEVKFHTATAGREPRVGELLNAYVLKMRPDGKCDASLRPIGFDKVAQAKQRVLHMLGEFSRTNNEERTSRLRNTNNDHLNSGATWKQWMELAAKGGIGKTSHTISLGTPSAGTSTKTGSDTSTGSDTWAEQKLGARSAANAGIDDDILAEFYDSVVDDGETNTKGVDANAKEEELVAAAAAEQEEEKEEEEEEEEEEEDDDDDDDVDSSSSQSNRPMLPLGTRSPPSVVAEIFPGMSKGQFKAAVGILLREGTVIMNDTHLELVPSAQRTPIEAGPYTPNQKSPKGWKVPLFGTMYVDNLAYSVDEGQLAQIIETRIGVGKIAKIRLHEEEGTGRPSGSAHVEFYSAEDAMEAMQALKGLKVLHRQLRVDLKSGNPRFLKKHAKLKGWKDVPNTNLRTAKQALLHSELGNNGGASAMSTVFAHDSDVSTWTTVYVGNLPYKITNEQLKNVVETNYLKRLMKNQKLKTAASGDGGSGGGNGGGAIKVVAAVRQAVNRETGLKRGFGYIDFLDYKTAQECVRLLQGLELQGRPLKLDVEGLKKGGNGGVLPVATTAAEKGSRCIRDDDSNGKLWKRRDS